jgi:uncharacterized membrane protein YeaQ/YmgE (transglycosylase-associated protein family)
MEGVAVNFVIAIVIGAIVGAIGWFVLRGRRADAVWLAPVLGIVGALVASVLATMFGDPGYGPKEATLQVVLAAVAVGGLAALTMRGGSVTSGKG